MSSPYTDTMMTPPSNSLEPTTTKTVDPLEPATTLDWNSYPHLFDRILRFADHPTLLSMRVLSTGVQERVYRQLLRHIVVRGNGEVASYAPHAPVPVSHRNGVGHLRKTDCVWRPRYAGAIPLQTDGCKMVPRHLVPYIKVVDAHHMSIFHYLQRKPPHAHRHTVSVVRYRLLRRDGDDPVVPFQATTEIWFVHMYRGWAPESTTGLFSLATPSPACTTAIVHCRFSQLKLLPDKVQLGWRLGVGVQEIVVICGVPDEEEEHDQGGAQVEESEDDTESEDENEQAQPAEHSIAHGHHPMPHSAARSLAREIAHGIAVRAALAKLVKQAMIERDVRLTIVNIHVWADMNYFSGTPAERVEAQNTSVPIDKCFLDRFDEVEPFWPNPR